MSAHDELVDAAFRARRPISNPASLKCWACSRNKTRHEYHLPNGTARYVYLCDHCDRPRR